METLIDYIINKEININVCYWLVNVESLEDNLNTN
jgi:hypothetical protein